jgi:ABC-2 type transport system permease protein
MAPWGGREGDNCDCAFEKGGLGVFAWAAVDRGLSRLQASAQLLGKDMSRYFRVFVLQTRNSLMREMSFKANFLLWTVVEILWFLGQVLFIDVLFSHVERIGDWTKWEVVALVGTHQTIAQLFQAFFYVNLTHIPELVRTGKLDVFLTLPLDAQFAVSTRQIGLDNIVNAGIGLSIVGWALSKLGVPVSAKNCLAYSVCVLVGVSVHYSVMCSLSTLCFWIVRAQGLLYGYFNLFNIGRHPDSVYRGAFKAVFSWVIPVIAVANVPTRILAVHGESGWATAAPLLVGAVLLLCFTRWFWLRGLSRYASASS